MNVLTNKLSIATSTETSHDDAGCLTLRIMPSD